MNDVASKRTITPAERPSERPNERTFVCQSASSASAVLCASTCSPGIRVRKTGAVERRPARRMSFDAQVAEALALAEERCASPTTHAAWSLRSCFALV